MTFLAQFPEHRVLPITLGIDGVEADALYVGKNHLEVVVFSHDDGLADPPATAKRAHKKRKDGRPVPCLVVLCNTAGGGITLAGIDQDDPITWGCADIDQARNICHEALSMPDRHSAGRYLHNILPSLATDLPGINNEGLLSLHALAKEAPGADLQRKAAAARGKEGSELINALGFKTERLGNLIDILLADNRQTALAVLLKEHETPESGQPRFNDISPISYALTKADRENIPWVLIIQGKSLRLYNTRNIGVGRRGRTETYIACNPTLLAAEHLGLLWLLFSAEALCEDGTVYDLLDKSRRFAEGVADKLRERIYNNVVPTLAMGIVEGRGIEAPSRAELKLTYEMALTLLFRLLFIAYAEDRDLLPYKSNESYKRRSLKTTAMELARRASAGENVKSGGHYWSEIQDMFKAISEGNAGLGVPAYNGAMFSSESNVSPPGAALAQITMDNTHFEAALRDLLLATPEDKLYAPVDFRALSVREFGTIYEGLLESELSLAEQDLTQDKNGTYLPAGRGDTVFVKAGAVYLHNRSGARKSSGSYYTPDFAVEHLLDGALEPAIDAHLSRLEGLSDADRADQFFDFRVADIAMGSGHFLVAAIDRIERQFAIWLETHPTPGIRRELQTLREAAHNELGRLADTVTIEDGQLLRRMIARRCIYGVDLNPLAVQLARLSVWIHTFVPGLPLSLLDHNLVHGNALVGVGTLDEVRAKFEEDDLPIFNVDAESLLGQAAEPLKRLARLSDASISDIDEGRRLMDEARDSTKEAKALCDLITAQPVAEDESLREYMFKDWEAGRGHVDGSRELEAARDILTPLEALHFPIAFPEVFLGRSGGFNVILGNPPWETVKVEEQKFWSRHFPGLRGLSQREFEKKKKELYKERLDLVSEMEAEKRHTAYFREILHTSSAYVMGSGDPDLYQAFSLRFLSLIAENTGGLGIILPRTAFSGAGSEDFRKKLIQAYFDFNVTILKNRDGWVFKDVAEQYAIALLNAVKSQALQGKITLKGPLFSKSELEKSKGKEGVVFDSNEIKNWSDNLSFPVLPDKFSSEIFQTLRQQPRLDLNEKGQWRVRPHRELDSTMQKGLMDLKSEECPDGFWPVYKGASFDLWQPDRGKYYAWGDPKVILPWLQERRLNSNKRKANSPHREFSRDYVEDEKTLAPLKSRIAFRKVTRATDKRTMHVALIPPKVFLQDGAPFLLHPRGDEKDEAYLLGVLSSIPLDWYTRRFVETSVSFSILNPLPIPRPGRDSPLWQRVVALAGRLACPDARFKQWAEAVGTEHGALEGEDREDKIHELDAVVAHLYGLNTKQLKHIFETFHEGWNGQPRLNAVLTHYERWKERM